MPPLTYKYSWRITPLKTQDTSLWRDDWLSIRKIFIFMLRAYRTVYLHPLS